MLYAICPYCGKKLLKADSGTKVEIFCGKCKIKLSIILKDNYMVIGKFEIKDVAEIKISDILRA